MDSRRQLIWFYRIYGPKQTAIIDLEDNLYVTGLNNYGQLGLGHRNNIYTMSIVPGIKCKQVSCGGGLTAVIDINQDLYIAGNLYNKKYTTFTKQQGIKAKAVSCGFIFIGRVFD